MLGVDRSLPSRQQPPLTTYDLLNVRPFPPSSDRLGGGTREGFSKLFPDQAGTPSNRRITGLDVLSEATNITDPNEFGTLPLAEDWSTQTAGDPTDLLLDWHPIRIGSTGPATNTNFSINGSQQLLCDSSSASRIEMILCSFFVDQSVGVTTVVQGDRTAGTANDGYATAFQPSNAGPVIGVSNVGDTGIFACFIVTAANTIQARIYEFSGPTLTQKATSADLVLDGTATPSDYTIKLSMDSGTGLVTAEFTATGVLTGPADINETLTYTTVITSLRGGIAVKPRLSGANIVNARTFDSVSLTKLIPPANTVFSTVDPNAAGPGDRYYLPSGWVGVERDNAGVLSVTSGGPSSPTDPNWPAVDDTVNTILVTNPGLSNADYPEKNNFALYQDQSARYGINLRMDPSLWDGQEDMGSAVFRASIDGRNALILYFQSNYDSSTNMASTGEVNGVAIVDNVVTDLGKIFSPTAIFSFFNALGDYRITDDGANINIYVNGILNYTFDPSSFPNWTSAIGTALTGKIGVGFTGGQRAFSSNATANIGKVEVVQGEVSSPINVSNVKNKLAIYSKNIVQIGDTNDLTISDVIGPSLVNPLPQSASFNRKFYAVDGTNEIIVDPVTLIGSDWESAVIEGTLPVGCRLIAMFRGSIYLAATNDNPSIWFKSRTLDPLDWDYSADPQVSTAVAGTNGEVGLPADAITALIPYSDDYLVFGMARSLGVLEGDPNYGGQFQIVSNEAGIVGPRAYTFDDRGNLYFVGAGGLYKMLKGSFGPEAVGPRKLRRVLEEVDIDTNLIQLEFRPSDRTVRIHITPTDGTTAGLHIVYDTRTDGFFFDQYPLSFGPWSTDQTNGSLDIDRNIIIGTDDGYVLRPDDDAVSDDGSPFTSYVEIVIPEVQFGLVETMCQEIQFVLGEGGAEIQWYWFTGSSPEEVRLQTVANGDHVASGTVSGTGFKPPIGMRHTGSAHKIRLSAITANDRWSLERITALLSITNDRRR